MAQFINTKETLVTEAIDGALYTAGDRLARLNGFSPYQSGAAQQLG